MSRQAACAERRFRPSVRYGSLVSGDTRAIRSLLSLQQGGPSFKRTVWRAGRACRVIRRRFWERFPTPSLMPTGRPRVPKLKRGSQGDVSRTGIGWPKQRPVAIFLRARQGRHGAARPPQVANVDQPNWAARGRPRGRSCRGQPRRRPPRRTGSPDPRAEYRLGRSDRADEQTGGVADLD